MLVPFAPQRFTRALVRKTPTRRDLVGRRRLTAPTPPRTHRAPQAGRSSPASSPPSPPRSPPTARPSTRPRSPPWSTGSSTAGIHGLVPCGTTGEFTSLSPEEHRRVIELYVAAAAGRVPVVAGVGSLTTQGAIDLVQHAERVGADAVMLVPPFYDPLDFATLKVFLAEVAAATSLPIVYYNVPGATGHPPRRRPDRRARLDRRRRLPQGHLRRRGHADRPDRQPQRRHQGLQRLGHAHLHRPRARRRGLGLGRRRHRARAGRGAVGDARGEGRPPDGARAVARPVGAQLLPRVGQLRRRASRPRSRSSGTRSARPGRRCSRCRTSSAPGWSRSCGPSPGRRPEVPRSSSRPCSWRPSRPTPRARPGGS